MPHEFNDARRHVLGPQGDGNPRKCIPGRRMALPAQRVQTRPEAGNIGGQDGIDHMMKPFRQPAFGGTRQMGKTDRMGRRGSAFDYDPPQDSGVMLAPHNAQRGQKPGQKIVAGRGQARPQPQKSADRAVEQRRCCRSGLIQPITDDADMRTGGPGGKTDCQRRLPRIAAEPLGWRCRWQEVFERLQPPGQSGRAPDRRPGWMPNGRGKSDCSFSTEHHRFTGYAYTVPLECQMPPIARTSPPAWNVERPAADFLGADANPAFLNVEIDRAFEDRRNMASYTGT